MNFLNNTKNRVLTAVCLMIVCACVYFIQDDSLFLTMSNEASLQIGIMEKAKKDVRRKNMSAYFWEDIKHSERKLKDDLNDGDSIFTGPESSVLVVLSSGQEMLIAPNSLIKFSSKNKKLTLDIPYGGVELSKVVQDLVIDDCGKSFKLNPDEASVNLKKSDKCGTIALKTTSKTNLKNFQKNVAEAEQVTEAPNTATEQILEESTANTEQIQETFSEVKDAAVMEQVDAVIASVENAAPIEAPVQTPLAVPRLKMLEKRYTLNPDQPELLKWEAVPDATGYELEISETYDFAQPDKYTVRSNKFSLAQVSGNSFYRIKTLRENQTSEYSEIGKIFVSYPQIKLTDSVLTKSYNAKNPKDQGVKQSFNVSWSEVPLAARYAVELFDPVTEEPLGKIESRRPAGVIDVPRVGNYNFKVHAYDAKGRKVSSSDVGQVVYEKVFSVLPPVIKPGMNSKFYFFQKNAAGYIWLNWAGQADDKRFRVELSKDRYFSTKLKSMFTKKKKLLVTDQVSPGDYYWRVRSDNDDKYSEWSEVQTYKVKSGQGRFVASPAIEEQKSSATTEAPTSSVGPAPRVPRKPNSVPEQQLPETDPALLPAPQVSPL